MSDSRIQVQRAEDDDALRQGSFIVDELSRVESAILELETQREILRQRMEKQHGVGYFAGDEYKVKFKKEKRRFLDVNRICQDMGQAWCQRYSRIGVVTTVKAEPLTAKDLKRLRNQTAA